MEDLAVNLWYQQKDFQVNFQKNYSGPDFHPEKGASQVSRKFILCIL